MRPSISPLFLAATLPRGPGHGRRPTAPRCARRSRSRRSARTRPPSPTSRRRTAGRATRRRPATTASVAVCRGEARGGGLSGHGPALPLSSPSRRRRRRRWRGWRPSRGTMSTATDFLTARFSGSGSVEGVVVPTTDVVLPPTPEPSSTSGCEPEDFPPAPAEAAIALVQRGTCTYQQKVDNAAAAGYAAVLIFNEGQPGRQEVVQGTLSAPVTIPAATTSFAVGEELAGLAGAGEARLRIAVEATTAAAQTANVIAETEDGSADSVVVIGAHLDSVAAGPGINDNGSGTATILEIALQLAQARDHHAEPAALRLLRRRGVGPARLDPLRRSAYPRGARQDRPQPQLRHARLAQPGQLRLRRRRLRRPARSARRARARSRRSSSTTCRPATCRPGRPPSTAARTTARSSPRASRPAGSSPGRRG